MKLKQFCSISSGVNGRRNPQGTIYLLGASDFVGLNTLNPLMKPSLLPSSKMDRHLLQADDLVVLAKGHHGFMAHLIKGDVQPAVASSVFLVLRDIAPNVLPEYLAWYINLNSTQEKLKGNSRGSALPAINRTILGELEIDIPPIPVQENIIAVDKLKKQESKNIKTLDQLKSTQLELLLKTKIHNNEH
ncbi:MAG: restriction endonuclease subunit S [Leeuwenhoekiella sp.]